MKREIRLYNIILPLWLVLALPQMWLLVLPGNLLVDCAVLLVTLAALRHGSKGAVVKKLWWRFWLLGFAADALGVLWMFLGLLPGHWDLWGDTVGHISHNAFAHPVAFIWTLTGVAIAGVCIYAFDLLAMYDCRELSIRERRRIALVMALVTAPWLFFVPVY